MASNSQPVREWFGHTRRERRASLILLAVLLMILFVRYLVPEQNMKVEDLGILLPDSGDLRDIQESEPKPAGAIIKYSHRAVKFSKPVADSSARKKPLPDLNSCDSSTLVALPGIGPVLASRIIKYRKLLGGYAAVEQLREVYGFSEETFLLVSRRVRTDTAGIRKIPVNSADYRGLGRLIYLDRYEISAILKYRQLEGRIDSIGELTGNKILTSEKAARVKPYMDFK